MCTYMFCVKLYKCLFDIDIIFLYWIFECFTFTVSFCFLCAVFKRIFGFYLHCYRNLHIYLSVCFLCKSDTWLHKLMRCIKWWGLHRGSSLISCWAACPAGFKEWMWKKTGPLQLDQCLLATMTTESSCSLDSLSLQSHKLDFFPLVQTARTPCDVYNISFKCGRCSWSYLAY